MSTNINLLNVQNLNILISHWFILKENIQMFGSSSGDYVS